MKNRVSRWALVIAIAVGLSLAAAQARAQAYKWKDASGHIHFTENYYEIPEKYRKNIETREMPTRAGDPAASGEEPDANEVAFQDGVRSMSGRDLTVAQQEKLDAWFKAWGTTWIIVGGLSLLANVVIALGLVAHAFINGRIGWGLANFFIGISTPVYLMVHVEQSMGVRLGMLALYLSPGIVFGVVVSQLVGVLA
jgi:hypothetical protein